VRAVLALTLVWFLAAPGAFAQEKIKNPIDGRDEGSLEFIKLTVNDLLKDKRPLGQIYKDNALIRAVWNKDANGVRKALRAGAPVDSYYVDGNAVFGSDASGSLAISDAVADGSTDLVKLLIEANADVNQRSLYRWRDGETPLYTAVAEEKNDLVPLLIKAGARGDPEQIRLGIDIRRAACKGFKLRDGEGYPHYPGYTGGGDVPDIAELVKRGADINARDPAGYTPLMYATNLGLVENVKTLLAHGADAKGALPFAESDSSWRGEERRQIAELLKAHLAKKK
jgi:ankyrin repeat protein